MVGMTGATTTAKGFAVGLVLVTMSGTLGLAQQWPFEVTDLRDRESLTILVFGDAGTGDAGQYRVGRAMFDTCQARGCDLAVMLGDNIYEDGIAVENRDDQQASFREIVTQFDEKFAKPYEPFLMRPGFHFWGVLGNHDYRRNASGAMVTYSEFSDLWRVPAPHYEIPRLPDWIQMHAMHTDTDERRDLNGLQVASIRRQMCRADHPNRWKLLFGHQPVYNSGHHRNDGQERRTRALVERPLILECGVHLYMSGHAHHQEHLTARGFEQVIQGAAARSKGRNNPRDEPHVRQRFFSRTFGFALLTVDPVQLRLDFYDVLNTREKASEVALPTPDEVVLSYSWCGTRDEIGQPARDTAPCRSRPRSP
jgi:hypothetical protein